MVVYSAGGPDLVVNSLNAYKQKGKTFIDVVVQNDGNQEAGSFTVKVEIPELGQVLSANIAGLAAGESYRKSFQLKLPGRFKGYLTFKATVDPDNRVAETDEGNNSLERQQAL